MPVSKAPATIVWLRQDLRLTDNPALSAAAERGGPVIPVFILGDAEEATNAAPIVDLKDPEPGSGGIRGDAQRPLTGSSLFIQRQREAVRSCRSAATLAK